MGGSLVLKTIGPNKRRYDLICVTTSSICLDPLGTRMFGRTRENDPYWISPGDVVNWMISVVLAYRWHVQTSLCHVQLTALEKPTTWSVDDPGPKLWLPKIPYTLVKPYFCKVKCPFPVFPNLRCTCFPQLSIYSLRKYGDFGWFQGTHMSQKHVFRGDETAQPMVVLNFDADPGVTAYPFPGHNPSVLGIEQLGRLMSVSCGFMVQLGEPNNG